MQAPCPADVLFREVEDLARYPSWLTIVTRVEPVGSSHGSPAWSVELRGRIGPLARSKRLRMERTVHEPDRRVRFERRELDGREHSPWVLEALVTSHDPAASELEMHLHYGGTFGGALVESLLRDEIEASRPRLGALVAGSQQSTT